MTRRGLLVLAVLLVALLAVRLAMRVTGSRTASGLADAGVHRVLSTKVEPDAVTWVQVTPPPPPPADAGAPPATARRYEKRDGAWVVVSMGSAPADAAALEAFVAKAIALSGETRGAGEPSWPLFGLADSVATKVELGAGAETVATLFVGKAGDDADAHFVRSSASPDVLHVQDGLRSALGLWGEGATLAADLWLRKDVLGLTGADVTRLVVERADGRLTLEKAAAPPPAPDGASAPAPEATSGPAPPSWTVTEPTFPFPARSGLDGVVDRAAQVRVAGTLDAESAACTAEPAVTVTFGLAAGGERVARVRGRVEGADDLALTIDGQPHCWSLSSWSLGTLAPRASALCDVPQVFADAPSGEAARVRIDMGGATATATRSGEEWKVTGAGLLPTRAGSVASAVRYLRVEDLVHAAHVPEASRREHATVTAEIEGKSLRVVLLGERAGGAGERYARVAGPTKLPDGWLLVLGKSTVDSLLP